MQELKESEILVNSEYGAINCKITVNKDLHINSAIDHNEWVKYRSYRPCSAYKMEQELFKKVADEFGVGSVEYAKAFKVINKCNHNWLLAKLLPLSPRQIMEFKIHSRLDFFYPDITDLSFNKIDPEEYPIFQSTKIVAGKRKGRKLTTKQLDDLNENHREFISKRVINTF